MLIFYSGYKKNMTRIRESMKESCLIALLVKLYNNNSNNN